MYVVCEKNCFTGLIKRQIIMYAPNQKNKLLRAYSAMIASAVGNHSSLYRKTTSNIVVYTFKTVKFVKLILFYVAAV